jgi:hypothetical protein
MVATDLTRCDDGDRDPCGIASWNDVRYLRGENGEQFAPNQDAYPCRWFSFILHSLCEGAGFSGQSGAAAYPVIDEICKVRGAFAHVCNAYLHIELYANVPDCGLRLDLNGTRRLTLNRWPLTVQELLDANRKPTEIDGERCIMQRRHRWYLHS